MGRLHPSRAQARHAVRRSLTGALTGADLGQRPLVLVACSGGADSLALAAATSYEASALGLRAGAVIVDHRLQEGSAQVAATARAQCIDLGLDPADVVTVSVSPGAAGPEAAARLARYDALDAAAQRRGATLILLGHTRDDQAEQVLLGLARGSGTRSLSGMPRARGHYLRPFLDLPRETTAAACEAWGLTPWSDPHNADPSYTRVRARDLLADLEARLGPGLRDALARSADLARADADALDGYADAAVARLGAPPWPVAALLELPAAVRGRVVRRIAALGGCPGGLVTSTHVDAIESLLSDWHGQGPVFLPGGFTVSRQSGVVGITPPTRVE